MFQSTHSLRSATTAAGRLSFSSSCFNPRTPCGVRPAPEYGFQVRVQFQSTHSLRSATRKYGHRHQAFAGFNPRTPCGVRLFWWRRRRTALQVSIHALLAECDWAFLPGCHPIPCFNPRTPCGVRPLLLPWLHLCCWFQSTHSLRSATYMMRGSWRNDSVSIHALLAECDPTGPTTAPSVESFNPRTPCGVRQSVQHVAV